MPAQQFGERQPSEFIQVTCYAALRYLADFKAGWSFGEGQAITVITSSPGLLLGTVNFALTLVR